jgi:LPXTG-motif cell wall-anchored protein
VLIDARTATVQVLLTQAALSGQAVATGTLVPGTTATALPKTGFAEDAGIPGLLGLTALLLVVILLARRMRAAN